MQRDGPGNTIVTPDEKSHAVTFPRSHTATVEAPASRLKSAPKPRTGTGTRKAPKPKGKRGAKPPKTDGYTWRRDGAGFELRKSIYVDDGTGTRRRRKPYVAHLSAEAFRELKRKHKGAALERAIADWIRERDT